MVENESNPSEQEVRLEQTSEYVANNIYATKEGRRCVDGRYDSEVDEYTGMISRPGGDIGYVMALMGVNTEKQLGLTSQECFEIVYDAITRDGDNFYMHTDQHADPSDSNEDDKAAHDHPLIGCGHAAKPTNAELAIAYGLNADDMADVVTSVKKASQEDEKLVVVNLPGDHKEQGVLSITDERYTVRSQNGNLMFFVYDAVRDEAYMRQLVERLGIEDLTFEDFKAMSDRQLGATLQLLAKGLPLYEVSGDPINPHVTVAGHV